MGEPLLAGKVAIVTGSGRGIGLAIATAMARAGAKVVINDVGAALDGQGADAMPAQMAVDAIRRDGGEAVANVDSVAGFASARRIVECARDTFGRLDCVVNNAGILRDRRFHRMEESDWDDCIGVMLKGAFNVSRHAAELFREQSSGSYIHMTSNSGLIGNGGQANYSAAKAGIVALSKTIAIDMARHNVRSNCIAPVAFTRMQGSIPIKDEATARRVASRREVTPDFNAPLAVYLASDLSTGVNAQVFCVRKNEIFLMSQSRPIRGLHRAQGWTPADCAEHLFPALSGVFYPPFERSAEVFPYDPI